jgi:hypothetical protein
MNKWIIYPLPVLAVCVGVGLSERRTTTSSDLECTIAPEGIPPWVAWDCTKQQAFEDGKLHFNKDSTMVMFPAEYNPFDTSKLVSVRLSPEFEAARRRRNLAHRP